MKKQNQYLAFKQAQEKGLSGFPMAFAFGEDQFKEGLIKLGLDPETGKDEVMSIGAGGFIRKTDEAAFLALYNGYDEAFAKEVANDLTGEGFIYDMFCYELANHEYTVTYRLADTLDALGLSMKDIEASPALMHGCELARKTYLAEHDDNYWPIFKNEK